MHITKSKPNVNYGRDTIGSSLVTNIPVLIAEESMCLGKERIYGNSQFCCKSKTTLICVSMMISGIKHLFICLLAICMSSLEKCLFSSLPIFSSDCLFVLSCMSSSYISDINLLLDHHWHISSPIQQVPFHFIDGFLCRTITLQFNVVPFVFLFVVCLFLLPKEKYPLKIYYRKQGQRVYCLCFLLGFICFRSEI